MKILVTRKIPEAGIKILKKFTDKISIWNKNFPIPKDKLVKLITDRDGVLCMLTDKIDRDVISAARKLKVISIMAAGYDNIDVKAAKGRGIIVTNTPGVLTETVADLTWSLILACARRIIEADRFSREGKFKGWDPLLFCGTDVYGAVLGIIGAGRIGQAVARRAIGFNMRILYYDPIRKPEFEKETGAKFCSLTQLLKKSDFVSLHCPGTKDTYHLITKKELSFMKSDAFLINMSRGNVVCEKDLIWALKSGKIKGAGLDVYEFEPAISKELMKLNNVVLLPHIGSASVRTRERMAILAAKNLISALEGTTPKYIVY